MWEVLCVLATLAPGGVCLLRSWRTVDSFSQIFERFVRGVPSTRGRGVHD